jgi:hypothetical protein
MGGEGDDGNVGGSIFDGADHEGGGKSVHFGHLVSMRMRSGFFRFPEIDGDAAVGCGE